jgi:hypothetical protein
MDSFFSSLARSLLLSYVLKLISLSLPVSLNTFFLAKGFIYFSLFTPQQQPRE